MAARPVVPNSVELAWDWMDDSLCQHRDIFEDVALDREQ